MKNKLRIIFNITLILSFLVLVVYANPEYAEQRHRESVVETHINLVQKSSSGGVRTVYLDIDEDSLYNEETGLFAHLEARDASLLKDAWLTIYNDSGKLELEQKVGVELSGGTSRTFNVKSFKIHGNKKYGYTKLKLDLSGGAEPLPGTTNPEKYNTIRLRSGSQDMHSGNIRSAIVSRLAYESGFDGITTTNRAIVFLNDNYYGVFDIQQNYSDSFLADKYNLANNNYVEKIKGAESSFVEGANLSELFSADLNLEKNRQKLEGSVDMDNYLLYYALNVLWNNTDWPQNSFEAWRYTGEQDPENQYSDGRWRFLSFDTDVTYRQCHKGGYNFFTGCEGDTFEALLNGKVRATNTTFINVIKSQYYQDKFLTILNNLLETAFSLDNISRIVDEEANKIAQIIEFYEPQYYEQFFWDNIDVIKAAAAKRPSEIAEIIKAHFGIDDLPAYVENLHAVVRPTIPDYSIQNTMTTDL